MLCIFLYSICIVSMKISIFFKKSNVNTVLNSDFEYIRNEVEHISKIFDDSERVIHQGRNTLKVISVGSLEMVVKKFSIPNIFNQFIYSTFRQSKAERSFYNSLEIIHRGFIAPIPIAYIEERKWGLLKDSYFLSVYEKEFKSIRPYMDGKLQNEELLQSFAKFTSQLHVSGILHEDYSPGNILWKQDQNDKTFSFCLVDVNRMTISDYDKEYYKNLARLSTEREITTILAKNYADYTHNDKNVVIPLVNKYSDDFFLKKTYKYSIRNVHKKPHKARFKAIWDLSLYFVFRAIRKTKILPEKINKILFKKEADIYNCYIRKNDKRKVLNYRYNSTKAK